MILKDLDDVRFGLERKAKQMLDAMPEASPDFLAGMTLVSPGASEDDLRRLEQVLQHALPVALRSVISSYEIAGVELAGVVFGGEAGFCEFLQYQITHPGSVWGTWAPVPGLLVVGSSSGYVLFASVEDGRVWACLSEWPIGDRVVVASDFAKLVQALGTLVLTEAVDNEDALVSGLAAEVGAPGSEAFWSDRVRGYA